MTHGAIVLLFTVILFIAIMAEAYLECRLHGPRGYKNPKRERTNFGWRDKV